MKRLPYALQICIALLLAAASACGAEEARLIGSKSEAIVNGELHEGHPAVGGFRHSLGGSCTATLIGAKTVLTAAHCTYPGAAHYFLLGDQRWEAERVIPHPRYTSPEIANDFAVVLLRQAPPVEPAAISGLAPELGQEVTLVGIGSTGDGGGVSGFKRIAKNVIAEQDEVKLTYYGAEGDTGNVCFGDSGGPSFAVINGQEVQVGVHSYIQGECGEQGNDMRVDVQKEWIVEQGGGDVRVGGYPDEEEPTLRFISPDLRGPLYPSFTLAVEASDDVGLRSVELFVEEISHSVVMRAPFRFSLDLEPGAHLLRAVATDLAGKTAEARATVEVVPYKALGERCEYADQCATPLCQPHPELPAGYCTQRCRPEKPCPDELECVGTGTDFVCEAPPELFDGSGCRLSEQQDPASWLALLLLLSLFARRQTRRSR